MQSPTTTFEHTKVRAMWRSPHRTQVLELQLHRKLQGSRRATLVQAAESSIRSAAAKTVRQGMCGLAEALVGQQVGAVVGTWVLEQRMVHNVERLCAEEQVDAVADREGTAQGNVLLPRAEAAKCVALEITLGAPEFVG